VDKVVVVVNLAAARVEANKVAVNQAVAARVGVKKAAAEAVHRAAVVVAAVAVIANERMIRASRSARPYRH
jgi:hypothetical protein